MKKSKILVPAVALLALSMGAAATGTVAWFSVSTADKSVVADTGNTITGTSGVTKSDAFTITAVTSASTFSGVVLTDDTGATKMTYDSGSAGSRSDVVVTPTTGVKGAEVIVSLTIAYAGSATTAAEIESAWDAAITSVTLDWEDTSDNTAVVKDPAVADTDYLKFVTSASNGAKTGDLDINTAVGTIPDTLGFPAPSAGASQVSGIASKTFYVGINGINGRIQDNWTYSFSVTPVVA